MHSNLFVMYSNDFNRDIDIFDLTTAMISSIF